MSELKLRRLTEHNQRLKEDLARPLVRVSEASARYRSCIPFGIELWTVLIQPNTLLQNDQGPPSTLTAFWVCWVSSRTNCSDSISMGSSDKSRWSLRTPSSRVQLHNHVNFPHGLQTMTALGFGAKALLPSRWFLAKHPSHPRCIVIPVPCPELYFIV